jgi:CheY-like chemotaxis protein
MRRRLSGSLISAGFAVHTCGDGLEALHWLQTNELPSLMITDVEMPNMDGLTLIDRCRNLGIQIPILVVSSRLSEDWGKEAQRVGADRFLNKGFTTNELLSAIENLLAATTPALSR